MIMLEPVAEIAEIAVLEGFDTCGEANPRGFDHQLQSNATQRHIAIAFLQGVT